MSSSDPGAAAQHKSASALASAPLLDYFRGQRLAWTVAVVATLVGAVTEPLIPALLKPLLDRGFTQGNLQLWMVPLAIMGVFLVRGLAQFVGQYALARIANDGMLILRETLFARLLAADMALFSRQSASSLSNTVVYEVQTGATLLVQALLGRRLYAAGAAGLFAVSQLAADPDRWLGRSGRCLDHENTLAPALSHHQNQPASHRLPGLRGGGKRAGAPHGALARSATGPVGAFWGPEPEPARPGDQGDHCLGGHDAADPTARCGRPFCRDLYGTLAKPGRGSGARCDSGWFCCLHHRHADVDRPYPPAGRRGQPDHPRRGGTGARIDLAGRNTCRNRRQPHQRAGTGRHCV